MWSSNHTSSDGSIVSNFCDRSLTRTFTARDACNNSATITRTVTWTADNTPPTFTGSYATTALGCNPANPSGSLGTATATDACGAVTITSSDGSVVSNVCGRSLTRTFTAIDGCNNTSTTSRTVTWTDDNIPPTFTGSYATIALGCNPANPAGSLGTATATDACGAVTITSSDGSIVSNVCDRSQTRTFTVVDACNNSATTSRTVTWTVDVTPPTFTGSYANVSLGCNPANPSGSLGTATATDACGAVTITSSDGSVVSNVCGRSLTRTFTAIDGCNNTSTTSRTVTWSDDNTPPTFTGSYANISLGCNPANPSGSLGTATATDACGAVTITSSDGLVVSNVCDRSLTRTFTARDACNNTATTSRTVTWTDDNTPPTFTGSSANVALGCNPSNPSGSLGTATATDACGTVTITSSDGAIVTTGCNRSLTRTFTARDACTNTSTTSQIVTWTVDVTPPTFTGSYANVSLGCNPANPSGSLGTATATDACGAVTITSSDGSVVSNVCGRSLTRTFTAIDGCNNTSTTSRTVTWTDDNIPPIFTGSYATIALGCNPANPAGSLGTATATDACGAVTITSSDGSIVSNVCDRSQTRTFTVVDACNNSATTSRTVTWTVDVTPPTFTGSYANVSLGCNPANPSGSLGTATATDACGAVTITSSDVQS
jgi:ethanolamine utilization microcompartment shell protein EutS